MDRSFLGHDSAGLCATLWCGVSYVLLDAVNAFDENLSGLGIADWTDSDELKSKELREGKYFLFTLKNI